MCDRKYLFEAKCLEGQRFFLNCLGGMDPLTNLVENIAEEYCTVRLSFPTRFCGATDEHCTEPHCVESMSLIMRYVAPAFEFLCNFTCFRIVLIMKNIPPTQ